ncbi:MAG: hypothetical protein Q8O47_10645 [Candidatus Bathyarchaeota archaeon]|nr:hypothetical protein [Candidatus Bathyarchaeota archaeon]
MFVAATFPTISADFAVWGLFLAPLAAEAWRMLSVSLVAYMHVFVHNQGQSGSFSGFSG